MIKTVWTFFIFVSCIFAQVKGDIEVPYIDFAMTKAKGVYSTKGKCNMCHSFGYILNQGKQSKAFWLEKTMKMVLIYKAPIDSKGVETVVDYLYANYGNGKLK